MIYENILLDDPIQQGDIFRNIPRVDFSLSSLAVFDDENEAREVTWRDVITDEQTPGPVTALLPIKPVNAIVVTQNCDAVRGQYICLCQVDDYLEAIGQKGSPPKNMKGWQSLIVRTARTNQRFFYLPPDSKVGFPERMVVDFRVILRVPRVDLLDMKELRMARLNHVAAEHFRESLGHFFRRYAYNEWYPLNKDEFEAYRQALSEPIEPYDWQK